MKSDEPEETAETLEQAARRLLRRLEAQRNRASGRSEEPEQIQSNVICFPGVFRKPGENGPEAASAKQVRRATAASGPDNRRQRGEGHRQRMGEW